MRPSDCARVLTAALRENKSHYYDGLAALILILLSQLLICALDNVTTKINNFPASILAMVMVAAVMIVATAFLADVDAMYAKYLRRPTDLINRHMSIGFTVPFTMIMKNSTLTAKGVGLIIFGFLITGLLNTALVYAVSFGIQRLIARRTNLCPGAVRETQDMDIRPRPPLQSTGGPTQERSSSYISDATTLTNNSGRLASDEEADMPPAEPADSSRTSRICQFAAGHPVLVLSLLGIAVVGIPVAAATGNDTALDTLVLFSLWTGTLAAQAAVKAHACRQERWRSMLATLLNAVLWSSLGTIAYTAAKAAVRHRTLDEALADFDTGQTLADVINAAGEPGAAATMGAGDIAASVLDAGIVIWGLKLFECRDQLLSRAGLTTLAVGSLFAVLNLVCGPLLLHAVGLVPASLALSFAARSVTLALAGPVMTSLGGDVGLNAAMVVFNGIVFQVAMGLGVRHWTARAADCVWKSKKQRGHRGHGGSEEGSSYVPSDSETETRSGPSTICATDNDRAAETFDLEKRAGLSNCTVSLRGGEEGADATMDAASYDSPATVATGMTLGINAAAMGTAYLYEEGSRAAPYAALSMTVYGVMTVVFTSVRPLAVWLVAEVSG